jgi:hypothetical protein
MEGHEFDEGKSAVGLRSLWLVEASWSPWFGKLLDLWVPSFLDAF